MTTLILTAILGILVICAFFIFRVQSGKSESKGPPTILLLGPSGSGKTSLLLAWQDSQQQTLTSVEPNVLHEFKLLENVQVVDCPGNEKLQKYANDYLKNGNIKAVIYMVDASSGVANIKNAASTLGSVLERTDSRGIPLLVATNKHDLFNTVSVQSIKRTLENEINELRDTRSRTVSKSGNDDINDDEGTEYLGVDGKPFQFEDLESEVQVLDGSVKNNKLSKWETWVTSLE
ncbi:Signal recognition particle receptor subunit beta [Starmerella bacillaris]|uniref:Signal recognition particle receptor subunit beta n=1 Tax=Starmerella bacillaris TaxID=1247836 RepID=A0AAV5RIS6_STABA|nr:Signal recognition particle receptor subunit beta [Starmerella bacillaris]